MWLSRRVMTDPNPEDPATLGTVSIGGQVPAVVTDAEKRRAKVISPGGYCWNPAATDCVLVVKGNELYLAGMPQDGTKGLQPGEVMLFSKGASVKVMNDGKIHLAGDVYVEGDLYVNGQKMEVPCMDNLLRDGDYVPKGFGGFTRLYGTQEILARALFRLTCRRGSFPFLPELGSRLQELGREKPSAREAAAKIF